MITRAMKIKALRIIANLHTLIEQENDMEKTNLKLHPRLQIAVDRLNKRYANITVKKYHTRDCYTGGTDPTTGNRISETMIVSLDLFTDVSPKKFAQLRVEDTYSDPSDHKFIIESRLIDNARSPRDEKHTTKAKNITKLVDEFARPFTLLERAEELLRDGQQHVSRKEWNARQKKDSLRSIIERKYFGDLIKSAIDGVVFTKTENFIKHIEDYKLAKAEYHWIKSNTHSNAESAVQVVAFQLGDRWVLNLFGGKDGGSRMVEFDSFDVMPDYIQQKIALLRIAPHNELLEEVGVKVQENSYFLYGQELQGLNNGTNAGEESKDQGN